MFERDHIAEYPDFTMDGTMTPDISMIRTRTPLPNGMDNKKKINVKLLCIQVEFCKIVMYSDRVLKLSCIQIEF